VSKIKKTRLALTSLRHTLSEFLDLSVVQLRGETRSSPEVRDALVAQLRKALDDLSEVRSVLPKRVRHRRMSTTIEAFRLMNRASKTLTRVLESSKRDIRDECDKRPTVLAPLESDLAICERELEQVIEFLCRS